jgi:hypothetical protein
MDNNKNMKLQFQLYIKMSVALKLTKRVVCYGM